jgi:hypothetical protein
MTPVPQPMPDIRPRQIAQELPPHVPRRLARVSLQRIPTISGSEEEFELPIEPVEDPHAEITDFDVNASLKKPPK